MDEDRNRSEMRVIETDLDDATPETLGTLPERLRQVGARQVSILPTTTKGSRPGHLVRAVVGGDDVEAVARSLARETGSLGVRALPATHAFVADTDRRVVVLDINGGRYEVGVKIGWMDDEAYDVSAEHTDATTVATETDLSPRDVMERAEVALGTIDSGFVVHLVERSSWEQVEPDAAYRLDGHTGPIPCTIPERVAQVATRVFDGDSAVLALVINPRALSTPITYEPTASGHHPQITGPVDREAIRAVHDVPGGPNGFDQPPAFSTHSSSSR